VEYFAWGLALAACGFVILLLYLDLSPRGFLYKVAKRFAVPRESLRPVVQDAPYRRRTSGKPSHKPVLLNLETSEGSGQACHPDIVHISQGFGPERWPYWLACTPYPYGDAHFENPEIFVSYDGINWSVPESLQNPLVPSPKNPGDHHSDPDLLFHANQLWLFYRLTLRGKRSDRTATENRIYLIKSLDGIRWTTPAEVLSDKAGGQHLSPAVIHDGAQFLMWTIEVHGGCLRLVRRSSPDGLTWNNPTVASVAGLHGGRFPWHIDVIQEEGRLSAALVSCTALGGRGARIHYAHSEDQGLTWVAGGFLFEQVYEFESKTQYRATLRAVPGTNHEYQLWYSAGSLSGVFSVAYLRVARTQDRLIPLEWAREQVSPVRV